MPHWLRQRHFIHAIDTFDENLCVWKCLLINKRSFGGKVNQVYKRNSKALWNLVHECYGDNKFKHKEVRPTKLVDFKSIGKHHNINIVLYEPKEGQRGGRRIYMVISLW